MWYSEIAGVETGGYDGEKGKQRLGVSGPHFFTATVILNLSKNTWRCAWFIHELRLLSRSGAGPMFLNHPGGAKWDTRICGSLCAGSKKRAS